MQASAISERILEAAVLSHHGADQERAKTRLEKGIRILVLLLEADIRTERVRSLSQIDPFDRYLRSSKSLYSMALSYLTSVRATMWWLHRRGA